ncbi:1-deoxy-D-xylulose-5-phosphate reductoisomerase, partial [Pseudomonas syringae pv. tagetis]
VVEGGLCEVAENPRVDEVMEAIVVAACLRPTLAAVEAGKKVLVGIKEARGMSGGLLMQAVRERGAVLLHFDSSLNAS